MTGKNNFISKKILDQYFGKTILISGGRGYIGSSLTQVLSGVNCRLIILDKNSGNSWVPKNPRVKIQFVSGDVSKYETWRNILTKVDYVFHLAALEYNRVNFNVLRDYKINALSVAYMLESCRVNKLFPKIIFTSSANIYKSGKRPLTNEKAESYPMSLWSAHKYLAENYLKIYAKNFGLKSVILRLANVYGPSANKNKFLNVIINQVLNQALNDQQITLFTNKNCYRDYIFIDDVVRALLYAGVSKNLKQEGNCYIVGSGEEKRIKDVWQVMAQQIFMIRGKKIKIVINDKVKLEPFDKRNFVADYALFSKYTGWVSQVFLNQGITLTIKALNDLKNENYKKN